MIIKEARHHATQTLIAHATEDALLEAELLLMHILGIDRANLYVRLEEKLLPDEEQTLNQLINRRITHEPLAYIVGHREFFGEDFSVAPGVLIPRPESELLVEQGLDFVKRNFPTSFQLPMEFRRIGFAPEQAYGEPVRLTEGERNPIIADIGTGSGAIAISLARLLPRATVYATDISPHALEIAALNCERHKVRVQLLEGDLLGPLPEPVDIIIANLPYVRDEELEELSAEIRMFEPTVALAGGRDGLDKIRQLLVDVPGKLRPGGIVLLEVGPEQGQALHSWINGLFPGAKTELITDLSGVARVFKVNIERT